MEETVIAVAHPGKLGDALYALPTVRYLCAKHNAKADFYTSAYCAPIVRLLEHQSCIRNVIVPEDYEIENAFCGVQPWRLPIPEQQYAKVYQLGLQTEPVENLVDHVAKSAGAPTGLPVFYEYPDREVLREPYIAVAPGRDLKFREVLKEFVQRCPIQCVILGAADEYIGVGIDATKLDPLETLPWLAKARGFVGLMSSPLVLANGFPIPKVTLHDGVTWNLSHVLRSPLNFYPVMPSAPQMLSLLGLISYSKTLHPNDYQWIGEAQHIPQMLKRLDGAPVRFEHQHRAWEYGLVLKALRQAGVSKVLDVGGGASLFGAAAGWMGMEVLQVDPADCGGWVSYQAEALRLPLTYVRQEFQSFVSLERFDAVTCLSVIEHVEDDDAFFSHLLRFVADGGLLCLTTDFHPSGEKLTDGHLRTYSAKQLLHFAAHARQHGFEQFGPKPCYFYYGNHVNDYTFASLILQKVR
ncbi:MAG: methyltransferase domain-containing protein [Bdellovibrionota bacterium]